LTFSGSQQISQLFTKIDSKYLIVKLNELSDILGIKLSDNAIAFLITNPICLKYVKLCNALNKIRIFEQSHISLKDLSKYFAARELLEFAVPEYSLFDDSIPFPEEYIAAAEIGAEGLFNYGFNQFRDLKKHCETITNFICSNKFKRICIIESPLGNVVPVQVLISLMDEKGIKVNKVSLSLPRNDRSKLGITFNEIIANNILSITSDNDLVLYVDDVISGSRFRKIHTALRKEVNDYSITLLPCALVFSPHVTPKFVWKPEYSKNRSIIRGRLEEIRKELGFSPWFEIPGLPKIKIDNGLPIVYESPVIWGEQPIVAGMKKVNFVFNIIEQFEAILDDIITNDYKSRDCLLSLWKNDTNGITYIIPEEILSDVFINIREYIDWEEIRKLAKTVFSIDYVGGIDELQEEDVRARWDWITNEVFRQVQTKIGEKEGHLVLKALLDLFTVMEKNFPEARDYNYCNYFLKYNTSVAKLNQRLIDLIMQIT